MKRTVLGMALFSAANIAAALPSEPGLGECVAAQSKLAPFNGLIAVRNGDARYFHKNGFADADSKRQFERNTPFRLASVGKLFTQAAVGTLLQKGKLKLEASVREYLPELPESYASVTITQLLQHRGGIAPMTRPEMADAPTMAGAKTARELVALVSSKPLSFAPGSAEEYSNGGYLLLGAVIESVSGESYRTYVAKHVFAALGMKSSSFDPGPGAAVPLTRLTGPGQAPAVKPQPRMEFPEFKASSAGDALSSVSDMEAFAAALLGDGFLKASTKTAVFPQRTKPWRLGQAGGSVGSNTGFWVYPDSKSWLIVLSNFDPPAGELMGQALLPMLAGQACKASAPASGGFRMGGAEAP